jgi:hypothetical protein
MTELAWRRHSTRKRSTWHRHSTIRKRQNNIGRRKLKCKIPCSSFPSRIKLLKNTEIYDRILWVAGEYISAKYLC